MTQTERLYGHDYGFENYAFTGEYYIYKDGELWQTYAVEKNEIYNANAYDNFYEACMELFEFFDLETTKYGLNNFLKLVK